MSQSHRTQMKSTMSTQPNMNSISKMFQQVPVPSAKTLKSTISFTKAPAAFKHIAFQAYSVVAEQAKQKKISKHYIQGIINGYGVRKISVILTAIANELTAKTSEKTVKTCLKSVKAV